MTECTLICVRHGETTGNIAEDMTKLPLPNHEFPLTSRGHAQALWAKKFLLTRYGKWDACYASTFTRSRETAKYLCDPCSGFRTDSRLNEKLDGIFHMLPQTLVDEHYPGQRALRTKYGWYHYRAPCGENVPDVELRIRSILRDVAERHAGETVVFSSHGTWMHILMGIAHNMTPDEVTLTKKTVAIPNCCINVYRLRRPFLIEPLEECKTFPPTADKNPIYA